MTTPGLLLGFLLSTLYGALFHFWLGGRGSKLLLFFVLSWIGFWVGHFVAAVFTLGFASLGPLNLGMATLGSIAILALGNWLSQIDIEVNE
jgi:hypothetical protein